jgi:hypothetical protein
MRSHMIKYHVLVPAAVFAVALVVGAPLGTALAIGMMSGCMSMMVMMAGAAQGQVRRDRTHEDNPSVR